MAENQNNNSFNFGEKLKVFIKQNKYSVRGYGEIVDINHSTLQSMMVKDTATVRNVSKMVQKDNRLLQIIANHFNSLVEEKNQVQFSQVAEPQATYQTKTPNQNKEIINLQRELIQLQQEVIRLNKEIIQLNTINKSKK